MDDQTRGQPLDFGPLDELAVTTLRTLAMDAVEQADSGHPGTPMALAPAAWVLYTRLLKHNPANPDWFDRDRFLLSCGHASMLLYGILHLTGYDLPLDELKRFRQWGSRTPGHPEQGLTPGVEVTTGPLGQGVMNAVGMAMAEAHLSAVYNREGHRIVDHHTFAFLSDGDLMEGASHEAASLAGHLKLGKLICLYDDNHITIDGRTELAFSDDVARRFESYGWAVELLGEQANDLGAIAAAFERARRETGRPSLIVLRSHIAYGAPHLQDSPAAHGAPLGVDEVRATKRFYEWPEEARFHVPEKVAALAAGTVRRGEEAERRWREAFAAYGQAHPELARQLEAAIRDDHAAIEPLPCVSPEERQLATRDAAGRVLNRFAQAIPWLVGGAADLASSTKAYLKGLGDFGPGNYAGRNFRYGVREHVMCGASNGMALHGGLRVFASTFLIFTDYARPAIRLAAVGRMPVIYLMSHDSIGLGEDGPTHQPIEHLASFRAMPHLWVMRPADANETLYALKAALERRDGPTLIALSRQKLPVIDRDHTGAGDAEGVLRGGYVASREQGELRVILIATGSELPIALAAQGELRTRHGVEARVVSLLCWELFREQERSWREAVLPPAVRARVAVEAAASLGWCEWVGEGGAVIGIDRFGASAPAGELYERLGITKARVVEAALGVVGGRW